jgi:hypothetical protein
MLEFDFRNGPLRRKYDGLKYCLKTIEDISFELSLHEAGTVGGPSTGGEPSSKKAKVER